MLPQMIVTRIWLVLLKTLENYISNFLQQYVFLEKNSSGHFWGKKTNWCRSFKMSLSLSQCIATKKILFIYIVLCWGNSRRFSDSSEEKKKFLPKDSPMKCLLLFPQKAWVVRLWKTCTHTQTHTHSCTQTVGRVHRWRFVYPLRVAEIKAVELSPLKLGARVC